MSRFFRSGFISKAETSQPSKPLRAAIVIFFAVSLIALFLLIGLRWGGVSRIKKQFLTRAIHESTLLDKNNSRRSAPSFLAALQNTLKDLGINPSDSAQMRIRKFIDASSGKDTSISISVRIPKGHPLEWLVWNISQKSFGTSYSISDCVIDEKKQRCIFSFVSIKNNEPRIQLIALPSARFQSGAAKMAIVGEVVNDSAYQTIIAYLSIPERLCISLIPGKKQSTLIAQLADQSRKEIIIRLPLEPVTKIPSGFAAPVIMVHYSEDVVRSLLSQAMLSVPHFNGFTNVWGSRALEDTRIMNLVLNEIQKKHGFFIENKTTKNSLAPTIAENIGLPYKEISGAILDKSKQADIEKQFKSFCLSSQLYGAIIITAPITPSCIRALKAVLPWLKQNGVIVAFVSEIVIKEQE